MAPAAHIATMTVPVWMLVGFATWTVLLLLSTVGVYRWRRILTGRVPISAFRADRVRGEDWYKRSMRAHANCIENLPVFGAIVLATQVASVDGPLVDALAITVLAARVAQSLVHVGLVQTDRVVAFRFGFFLIQLLSFLALAGAVLRQALLPA